jgi:hypothetical protein
MSRSPLNFQPVNLLCWLDRPGSARSGSSYFLKAETKTSPALLDMLGR